MHHKVPTTFKSNVVQGQHRSAMLTSVARQRSVTEILKYVLSELYSAQTPMVKSDLLSLVNVYSPDFDLSVGYSNRPDPSVVMVDTGLVFTFSMVPRILRNLPFASQVQGKAKYARLWGSSTYTEYFTVCVPRGMIDYQHVTLDSLTVLYNAVGVVSRNYCSQVKAPLTKPSIQPEDVSVSHSHVGITLQNMVNNLPFPEWVYCNAFWKSMSHTLIPSVVDKDFPLYYTLYIDGWVYEGDIESQALAWVKAEQLNYVTKGLGKLSSGLITGYVDATSPEVQATLHLILRKTSQDISELESNASSRSDFVTHFTMKAHQLFGVVPELQSKVIGQLTRNQSSLARGIAEQAINYKQQAQDLADYFELILGA